MLAHLKMKTKQQAVKSRTIKLGSHVINNVLDQQIVKKNADKTTTSIKQNQ